MAWPLFVKAALALGLGYLIVKPHPTKANPFPDGNRPAPLPVPVPPPSANGGAPAGMVRLPGVDLVADFSRAAPGVPGQSVPVTWTFTSGPSSGDQGGGTMPLAWLSPDRSQGAIVWNVDPAYFLGDTTFTPGAVYSARALQPADANVFATVAQSPDQITVLSSS